MNGCKVRSYVLLSLLQDRQQHGLTSGLVRGHQTLALVIALEIVLCPCAPVLGLEKLFDKVDKANVADLAQIAWRPIGVARWRFTTSVASHCAWCDFCSCAGDDIVKLRFDP